MKSILTSFAKNQSFIFKLFLFILSTVLIIYLLPKGGQFKYNFQKGKPWQYENLYAPFSFTIQKSKAEIEEEKEYLREELIPYFEVDISKKASSKSLFLSYLKKNDSIIGSVNTNNTLIGTSIIDELYTYGITNEKYSFPPEKIIYLKKGNELQEIGYNQLIYFGDLNNIISTMIDGFNEKPSPFLQELLF